MGEASPFSLGNHRQSTETIRDALQQVAPELQAFNPSERQQIELVLREAHLPSAARAALDVALHDWLGKRVGLPLWRLWGLDVNRIVPTSVTIGINSAEVARARVRDWLQFSDVRVLKVKLGSPAGISADQAMLMAVRSEAPAPALYVDANGGWSLSEAIVMCNWLASVGVKYVEQPLPQGEEKVYWNLRSDRPSPSLSMKAASPVAIFRNWQSVCMALISN